MKPCHLRSAAMQDQDDEIAYYAIEASFDVADKLVDALTKALHTLSINPGIGSPELGKALGIEGLRTWIVEGFPLSFWYIARADCVDVIRLLGHRQDQAGILREIRLA